MRLNEKIEDKGFPADYAEVFYLKIMPMLDSLGEADRLAVESCIPTILEIGEEAWLPNLPSLSKIVYKVVDPSSRPQGEGNRCPGV